jgi:serine/threonine-protein kinase
MLGETIDGRYRILRVLGEGGMGAVYEAEHTGTGRGVALKVIHAQMATKADMVARFQREARAAGSIETPHIVQVLDTGTDSRTGVIYMAMELLRGEDVQSLLKRLDRLPVALALRLVGQACIGLGKAHEAGVIHRDIKPANLFLSMLGSGEVVLKVVDFGIAKMMEPTTPEDEALTRTGGMVGSPLYMSPEQAMARKTIDHRTDIWSLGVVLYKALTGRAPHADTESGVMLLMAICSEPTPPIQDLAPWVPPEVARIVHRMLARLPDERFPSMAAVLEAIQPLVPGGMSIRAVELVALGAAEQSHTAARAVLEGDTAIVRGGAAPAIRALSDQARAGAESAVSVSQGTTLVAAPSRKGRLGLLLAVPLALGIGGLVAYKVRSAPAPAASSHEQVVAALVPSATPTAPPIVAPAPPPDERTVRLAVEPADATAEVDGRATPVSEGTIELHGVIGSAHHVRLVKGLQETVGEVAITSLGAVPPRMQVDVTAQKAPARPLGGKLDAGRGALPASPSAAKPSGPLPADKFE